MRQSIRDMIDENGRLDENVLSKIFDKTVKTIEDNKQQFFEIYDMTRNEIESASKQLDALRGQTMQTMNNIDSLMKQEQRAKQNFAKVSSSSNVSEDEIKNSYEEVKTVQVALNFEQDRWKKLGEQGDKAERRLKTLNSRLKQIENLSLVIGSMQYYLSSRIRGFIDHEDRNQKEKSIGAQIIKAQEDERHRLSRELHEGVAQDVENMILQSSITEKIMEQDIDEAKRNLQDLRSQLRDCLSSIQQIMFDLRPLALENFGLAPAIRQLVHNLAERGILSATFSKEGKEIALPRYIEAAAFRIVQESLNNVARHSGTDKAQVRLLYSPSALAILVQDDGKGFDPDENIKKQESIIKKLDLRSTEYYKDNNVENCSYGMLGMRERAKVIGAELKIISAPGKGTKVHCKIPFKTGDIARAVENEKIDKAISRAMSRGQK